MTFNLDAARALHDRDAAYSPYCASRCTDNDRQPYTWPCPTATALGATGRSEWLDPTDDTNRNRVHIDKTGWYYIGPGLGLKPDTTTVANFDTAPECGTQTRAPEHGLIICGRPPGHVGYHRGTAPCGDNYHWKPGEQVACTSHSPGQLPCELPTGHPHAHRNGPHAWPYDPCPKPSLIHGEKQCILANHHEGPCLYTLTGTDIERCTTTRDDMACALLAGHGTPERGGTTDHITYAGHHFTDTCGAVTAGFTRYPCLLTPGHDGDHQDSDGDTWEPEDDQPVQCTSTSPGGTPCIRPHGHESHHAGGHVTHQPGTFMWEWSADPCTKPSTVPGFHCTFNRGHDGDCEIHGAINIYRCEIREAREGGTTWPCWLHEQHSGPCRNANGITAPEPTHDHAITMCTHDTGIDNTPCMLDANHRGAHVVHGDGPYNPCNAAFHHLTCIMNSNHTDKHINHDGTSWGECRTTNGINTCTRNASHSDLHRDQDGIRW